MSVPRSPHSSPVANLGRGSLGHGEPSVWRSLGRRLAIPLIALAVTHVVGTVGYYILWHDQGGTVLDGLFMTFTTVATIGFGEVRPLDTAGRVLTMAVNISPRCLRHPKFATDVAARLARLRA